jgi:antitoxin FitA
MLICSFEQEQDHQDLGAEQGAKASRKFCPASAVRALWMDRYASVMHNECMPLIQIRDVPEPVRDELARKAAAAGQSMQAYLLGELSKLAERPSMAEIVARAQARARATGSTVTMNDAVAAVRAARDRQEP